MALTPGTRLGPYEVTARIGAGGMGEVYRSRDLTLGRDVAIKVLPDAFEHDPERFARFEREARVLASLNHPGIAQIYGFEQSAGIHALVMELVEGPTLADRIAQGAMPLNETLSIARQIAEALEAAHEQGIVHRDLKPANIKVRPDGAVKVLDFGLAKATESAGAGLFAASPSSMVTSPAMTHAGMILGTAAYMSPEQARGNPVDKRTDIWAFGCVLYEMLTARRAFPGDTLSDTIAAVLERDPDWSMLPATVRPSVVRLIRRCLEKHAKLRLRDIGDARQELDEALSTDVARTSPSVDDGVRAARRWRGVAVATIAALVVTLALTLPRRDAALPSPSSNRAVASQLTNYGGTEAFPALSPDGRSFAFVSSHQGTPDIWLRQVSGGEPVRLTDDAAEEENLVFAPTGEAIYFTRIDADGTAIWQVGALPGQARKVVNAAFAPAPSPDGRSLAYFETNGGTWTLVVSALDGSGKRELARDLDAGAQNRPAWSPDGRWIAYCRTGLFSPYNVFLADVDTGASRQVTHHTRAGDGVSALAWLPDSRHLAATSATNSDIGILDIDTGTVMRLTIAVGQTFSTPSLSADGRRLIATASRPRREVWKVPFGTDPETAARAAVRVVDESWQPFWVFVSRDGQGLLFNSAASGGANLWMRPLGSDARPRQITVSSGRNITHSSLSPDGTVVAFASGATGNFEIWTANVDGSGLRQLTSDAAAHSWPVWSPDGQSIVFTSQRTGDGRQETWRIPAAGGQAEKVADGFFRGDWIRQPAGEGTWIVTSTTGGTGLRLLDGERGTVIWEKHQPGISGLSMPAFSPDGRRISLPVRESRDYDAIWVFDSATGQGRRAARLPFNVAFRASWVDAGRAWLVNSNEAVSHIVMFDEFWMNDPETQPAPTGSASR